ncbi:hypothetical protein PG991_014131 [Apiospora marii]|uniref:Stc1 domain-containing protein n=1 Tax=Apiospora marii TaxID=335849 RepID=A0ABR1R836_9PEZI
MCKQYVYLSLCLEHDCESIVGKKGRNAYCRTARRGARRLGFCDGGLAYAVIVSPRHRGTVVCDECKQLRVLRQLSASVSAVVTTVKGEDRPTDGDEMWQSDDGGGDSSSSRETVRGDDDEEKDTGSLRFFASEKEKEERLASAYDFDLAMEQEVAALDITDTRAASPEEEEAYLTVTGGPDDSTIEYENNVPELTRQKGLKLSRRNCYGFAAVVVGKGIFPQPHPQSRPQYVDQDEVQWVKKRQIEDEFYDSDATGTVVVMTPSGSESESGLEMRANYDFHSEIRKKISSGTATASDTAMDADSLSSDGEPEFNEELDIQLRPEILEILNRTRGDRVRGRDIMITPTNPRRGLVPEEPLATDERAWSEDEDDEPARSDEDEGEKKEDKSPKHEKDNDDDDDERGGKRTRPSSWNTVLEDRAKRRRTA